MNKKAKKYPLHKELKHLTHMTAPACQPLLPGLNKAVEVFFRFESDERVIVEGREISGYEGEPVHIDIITSRESQKENSPCLIFFHGGGFIFKAAGSHIQIAKDYAYYTGCKVVYVDYRLAPKYRFPIPVEDCYASYLWVLEHAKELRIDPDRVMFGGDSAGGNLAAAVTLMAKRRGVALPKAELLIYPVLDRRMITESAIQYTDSPVWNSKLTAKMWELYLGGAEPKYREDISPMEAPSLADFPMTYLEVAQYDSLKDEGIAFAKRLADEGVMVELHEVKQACHGFESAYGGELMKHAMERRINFLKKCIDR